MAEPDVHGRHHRQHRHRHRAGAALEENARQAQHPRLAKGRCRARRQARDRGHGAARARRHRRLCRRQPDLCRRRGRVRELLRQRGAHHGRVGRDQEKSRRQAPLRQLCRQRHVPRAADRRRRGFLRLAPDAGGQARQKAAAVGDDARAAKPRQMDRRDRHPARRGDVHQGICVARPRSPHRRDEHGRLHHRHDPRGAVPADEPCARGGRGASGAAQDPCARARLHRDARARGHAVRGQDRHRDGKQDDRRGRLSPVRRPLHARRHPHDHGRLRLRHAGGQRHHGGAAALFHRRKDAGRDGDAAVLVGKEIRRRVVPRRGDISARRAGRAARRTGKPLSGADRGLLRQGLPRAAAGHV